MTMNKNEIRKYIDAQKHTLFGRTFNIKEGPGLEDATEWLDELLNDLPLDVVKEETIFRLQQEFDEVVVKRAEERARHAERLRVIGVQLDHAYRENVRLRNAQ